jgi:hypothetical protein
LRYAEEAQVISWIPNAVIASDAIELQFPQGARVYDQDAQRKFHAGSENPGVLSAVVSKSRSRWRLLVGVIVLAVVTLVTANAFRRGSDRTRIG